MARLVKHLTKDFTVVNNAILKNKKLTMTERGLLITLISLPDNWSFSINGLAQILPDGRTAINTAVNSLINAGYIVKMNQARDSGKFSNGVWIVSDDPDTLQIMKTTDIDDKPPFVESPLAGKPVSANPITAFPTQYKNITQSRKQGIKKTSSSDDDESMFDQIISNVGLEQIDLSIHPEIRKPIYDAIITAISNVAIEGRDIGTKSMSISNIDALKAYLKLCREHIVDVIKRIEPSANSIGDLVSYVEIALYREVQDKPTNKNSFHLTNERNYDYDELMKEVLKTGD